MTSEYKLIRKDPTVTSDKQGRIGFQPDKVEECIKLQCVISFQFPVCVNQGTFVEGPMQELQPPLTYSSLTQDMMSLDIM